MGAGIAARVEKSQGAGKVGSLWGIQNSNKEKRRRLRRVLSLVVACALLWGASAAKSQREKSQPQPRPVAAERYEIEVSFQPERSFLHARAGVALQADPSLQDIEFELNPHLRILEVADAQGRKLEFERSGRLGSPRLSVRLAEPVGAGRHVKLTFTYEGGLPVKSLDYITKDGILLRDESRWYPAVDLAAFTQNDLTISVPPALEAITSGELVEQHTTETVVTFRWKTSRPASSRSLVAYPRREGTLGGQGSPGGRLRIREVCRSPSPSELTISCGQISGKAHDLLLTYGRVLGPYPYENFTIVPGFPGQLGATGYSAPEFLVVSEDVTKFFGYPGYAPEFLPHEIAHQWFPIEVTVASPEDGWLAESLAEYLAWRYLEETDPEQARRMVTRAMRDALAPEPLPRLGLGLRLFALENWEVTHATLYQRGLLVWRTLEAVIDRERVDLALRAYYRRYAGRSASITDFREICEEISGRNLGWFFDYFLRGTRIPEIEFRRLRAAAPNEASGEIIFKEVPRDFQVRVEMRLETTAGPVEHSVATGGEVTPFTATSKDPVTRIALDPDLRILRWTEAARRNRSQRALLAAAGELESKDELVRATDACQKALALDPEDLARNEQQIRFQLGRLLYRMKQYPRAAQQFGWVLELGSLDPMGTDFHRAWARVYRARIEKLRGHPAAARAEAQAGLAKKSPALETPVALPEAGGHATTAAAELRALAQEAAIPRP